MYSRQWDYRRLTITLVFVEKLLLASLWTDLYLCSVGMRKVRGDQYVTHFLWEWEQPLSIDVVESPPGDKDDEGDDQ